MEREPTEVQGEFNCVVHLFILADLIHASVFLLPLS
jgi:hypothetical protein